MGDAGRPQKYRVKRASPKKDMVENQSLARTLAELPEQQRQEAINSLSQKEAEALIYDWAFWARPKQLPPDWDWYIWLLLSGRGGGKTRAGAELTIKWAKEGFSPIALVASTAADVRDTMVEVGDSAILNVCPPWFMPAYEPSKRRLTFPNGVLAIAYSGDEPEQLRGPQHCFVAGTLIATPYGQRPIETIRNGDYVITRQGKRKVIETFCRYAEVGKVKFSNGAELVATAQHPVLQLDGWMRISTLTQGEMICTGERLLTDTSQLTLAGKRFTSIDGFGSNITGLSQKVLKFIIGMKKSSTTILATCFSRQSHRIVVYMTELGKELWLSAKIVGQTLLGLEITPVPQFAGVANLNEQRNGGNLIGYAKSAEIPINHGSETPTKETSVVSVVSTWEHAGRARVYNITVEDQPEYIANGIIVHNCKAWVDELRKFKYPQDTWDNLMFGLRIGDKPQAVVTTTPRPIKTIKDLVADSRTAVTRGHTLENKDNLAPDFLKYILRKYEGTRLGRQELAGEILDDNPDALWERGRIDELRIRKHPDLIRVVVAIDPAGTAKEDSADTGIIIAGIAPIAGIMHGYILDDLTLKGTPDQWATAAVTGFHKFKADKVVGEINNGGDMVQFTVKTVDKNVPFKSVHASRGKYIRAEPVSALYEQGRVHHVGFFPDLEDQLCLAEGTLVATVNGDKPIQTLEVGDMVWTRRGLRSVEGIRCNGVKTILQVETRLGYNIGATGNHPFYHQDKGWVIASELKIGDKVLCLSPSSAPMSNIRESITSRRIMATGGVADAMAESHCIELCGKMLMGPSLKAMKSITGMKTGAIIHLTTLPAYPSQETRDTLSSIAPVVSPLSPSLKEVSRCGRIGRSERALKSPALNAKMFLSDALHTAIFAPVNVISDTIVSISELAPVRVWDLQIAAEHEYFAGGYLVHNCEWVPGDKSPDRLDALVWGITELMLEPAGKEFMVG